MFCSIEVPFDGSPFAEHPLPVRHTEQDKAIHQVVRVHIPMADGYHYRHGPFFANLKRALMDQACGNLDEVVGFARRKHRRPRDARERLCGMQIAMKKLEH